MFTLMWELELKSCDVGLPTPTMHGTVSAIRFKSKVQDTLYRKETISNYPHEGSQALYYQIKQFSM